MGWKKTGEGVEFKKQSWRGDGWRSMSHRLGEEREVEVAR